MAFSKKIAPSILSADFGNLCRELGRVSEAGADYIHIDVMDGHFVPNITLGPCVIKSIRKCTDLPFDVHLMIERPERYIKDFAEAGADIVSVHVEACDHLDRVLRMIKDLGLKAGACLNPATSPLTLEYVFHLLDIICVMGVNPGFGGQTFIKEILEKISYLKGLIKKRGLNIEIEVDGGVNLENISLISKAGCDIFVAGFAIFKEKDYKEIIGRMKKVADEHKSF